MTALDLLRDIFAGIGVGVIVAGVCLWWQASRDDARRQRYLDGERDMRGEAGEL